MVIYQRVKTGCFPSVSSRVINIYLENPIQLSLREKADYAEAQGIMGNELSAILNTVVIILYKIYNMLYLVTVD